MSDSDYCPATADQMTDAQMRSVIGDADQLAQADTAIHGTVADLLQAPFSADVQRRMVSLLESEQIQQANEAARRLGGAAQ